MARADSDSDQSSENEVIPFRQKAAPDQTTDAQDSDSSDDENEDAGEDTYVVEEICSHAFDENGILKYEVKWLGYEKKADRTWEPEDNLQGAREALDDYFSRTGGRPQPPSRKGKGSQKRKISMGADATENGEGSSKSSKRGKASAGKQDTPQKDKLTSWEPPRGTWEDDVNNVDAVEEQADATTGEKIRQAFIMWNDGRKTMHPLHVINQKCPQKMLKFYEEHLVFKVNDAVEEASDTEPRTEEKVVDESVQARTEAHDNPQEVT